MFIVKVQTIAGTFVPDGGKYVEYRRFVDAAKQAMIASLLDGLTRRVVHSVAEYVMAEFYGPE